MKQLFTPLLAILAMTANPMLASSQPVLTAATSVPPAGYKVRTLNSDMVMMSAAGASGANQSWDISAITFDQQIDSLNFRTCGSTDDCGRYSGATILGVRPQVNGLATNYYMATTTALSLRGNKDSVSGQSFHHIYSNPLDVLRFPMTYQSAFVDSFAVFDTATNGTRNHYRKGVDSVLADGWGTLTTPSGTFTNTLRIKETGHLQDSTRDNFGNPVVTRSEYTVYRWHDAAHAFALAQSAEFNFGSNTIGSFVSYADVPGTATAVPALQYSLPVTLSPNPAHSTVSLAIASSIGGASVTITDMTGRGVYSGFVPSMAIANASVTLDVRHWVPGIYAVLIQADGLSTTQKLIIR